MNKATIISSRAIAEIIGKRHLDVCRDISEMLKEIHGADMNIEDIDGAATSYSRDGKVSEYYLDKQHAFALARGNLPAARSRERRCGMSPSPEQLQSASVEVFDLLDELAAKWGIDARDLTEQIACVLIATEIALADDFDAKADGFRRFIAVLRSKEEVRASLLRIMRGAQ